MAKTTVDKHIDDLKDISRHIVTENYLEDILQLVVTVSANVTDIKICSLWLIEENEGRKKIHLKATQSLDPGYFKNRAFDLNEGLVGFVAHHGEPVRVADVLEENRFKEKGMARKLGLVSMLAIPLKDKGRKVMGVLTCFTTEPHAFSPSEVDQMNTVANLAANAILDTELLVRTRIAQEELATQALMEKARTVLMRERRIDADEATDWIEKYSTGSLKSPRRVAEDILLSATLGNN